MDDRELTNARVTAMRTKADAGTQAVLLARAVLALTKRCDTAARDGYARGMRCAYGVVQTAKEQAIKDGALVAVPRLAAVARRLAVQ